MQLLNIYKIMKPFDARITCNLTYSHPQVLRIFIREYKLACYSWEILIIEQIDDRQVHISSRRNKCKCHKLRINTKCHISNLVLVIETLGYHFSEYSHAIYRIFVFCRLRFRLCLPAFEHWQSYVVARHGIAFTWGLPTSLYVYCEHRCVGLCVTAGHPASQP